MYFFVLGQNLAVFRDDKGEAYVLDAYCPHMGANIAVGGHVIGDCLECPFHGWQFRGSDGKVTKIPYADKSKYTPPGTKYILATPQSRDVTLFTLIWSFYKYMVVIFCTMDNKEIRAV